MPDLGGHPAIATDGGGAQEIDSPEVSMPGMYRVVCVELQLDNLAVNTVLESKSLHSLEGVDISKDLVREIYRDFVENDPEWGHRKLRLTLEARMGLPEDRLRGQARAHDLPP